jgi:hypothetical protein
MKSTIYTISVILVSFSLGWFGCSLEESKKSDSGLGLVGASGQSGSFVPNTGVLTGGTPAQSGSGAAGAGAGGSAAGVDGGMAGVGGMTAGVGGTTAGVGGTTAGTSGTQIGDSGTQIGDSGTQPGDSGLLDASNEAAVGVDGGDASLESGADSGPVPPTGTCLQGTGDFTAAGPYAVQTKQVTIGSKGAYTIFYPNPLETNCPHPIVAWGNGTTITGGTAYAHFNEHMASWGIVAIASHNSNVGDGTFLTAAIDYLLEQNEDASSEFFGKLSTRAGVSGHSQGGAGADRASTHPNVEANGNVQGSFGTPPGGDVALLCLTGTADINPTGCPRAVDAISTPAMVASYDGMSHIATLSGTSAGSKQYARLLSAWFRCFLADDTQACAMFKGGENCPVCQEPGWDLIYSRNY